MEENTNTELIRSHVDTIILRTLQSKDSYPYEILREIENLSDGKYVLKQATLYSCMKRLEKLGYINSYWGTESEGGRRRYYSLTENGVDCLNRDKEEWEYSRTIINRLLSDKEIDLNEVTPPFDASSLRPLTKRGFSKETNSGENIVETTDEKSGESTDAPVEKNEIPKDQFKNKPAEKAAETEKAEEAKPENPSEVLRPEDSREDAKATACGGIAGDPKSSATEQCSDETRSPDDTFQAANAEAKVKIDAESKTADETTNADETSNTKPEFERANRTEVLEGETEDFRTEASYYTKEPIFQHTLPEEDRNSFASGAAGTRKAPKRNPENLKPPEESEDMKAAAELLRLGKPFFECAPYPPTAAAESAPPCEKQSRAQDPENYRDVLNRIFDTENAKPYSEPRQRIDEAEAAAAMLPTKAELMHGRHLKDLQANLEKQGFQLKLYNPKNRSDYYYNKYIYQNKLNFVTNLLLFVCMAAEFIAVAALNGNLGFRPITLILSGIAIAVPPAIFAFVYLWNPVRRVRADYNFTQTFLYRLIVAFIVIATQVIVCLLAPALGIGFNDPRMYVPWLFALNIPLYSVIYNLLYRSKRFHLACPKY